MNETPEAAPAAADWFPVDRLRAVQMSPGTWEVSALPGALRALVDLAARAVAVSADCAGG